MHLDKSAFSQLLAAWLSESIDKTNFSQFSETDLLKFASEPKKIQIDGKSLRASCTSEHT